MDPRSWSAADRAAIAFLMLKRQYKGNTAALRDLFLLVEDTEALAALDRQVMGQPAQVEAGGKP